MSKDNFTRRVISIGSDKVWVIKSSEASGYIPLDCPICDTTLRDKKDAASYEDWECCVSCSDKYGYPNLDKWKKGWRPSMDERNAEREKRRMTPSYLV